MFNYYRTIKQKSSLYLRKRHSKKYDSYETYKTSNQLKKGNTPVIISELKTKKSV